MELERDPAPSRACLRQVAVVGAGRLGRALAPALDRAGYRVLGPLGRQARPLDADVVLLCVPDEQIARAAAAVALGPAVGHCSGATGLDALAPHQTGFSLHPLMSVTGEQSSLRGASAAIAGTNPRGLAVARELAEALGMDPIRVAEEDRVAYHAAACMASNFLVALEAAAERLAATSGVGHESLVPLVRATVENWARLGGAGALTGPVARGDEATVERQRAVVAERTPELIEMFEAMVSLTRRLRPPSVRAELGRNTDPVPA